MNPLYYYYKYLQWAFEMRKGVKRVKVHIIHPVQDLTKLQNRGG